MTKQHILLFFLILTLITACQALESTPPRPLETISGEASYRERILLPAGAILQVSLEDSQMDGAAEIIAGTEQQLSTAPPYLFHLEYPTDQINLHHQYNLRARIEVNGELRFTTTTIINPFTTDEKNLKLLLHAVPKSIPTQQPMTELKNTYWRLLTLGGREITMAPDQHKEAFLQLSPQNGRTLGFSGCNNFSGSYDTKDNDLKFGPLMSTMMACESTMAAEHLFLKALADTRHFSIHNETLTLYAADQHIIATFAAMYFQ